MWPFALRQRALRPALRRIGWVLAFGAIEMAGPFLLLGHAEQTLPSGLTGLLVATVPLFAAMIAFTGGDRSVLKPARASKRCTIGAAIRSTDAPRRLGRASLRRHTRGRRPRGDRTRGASR